MFKLNQINENIDSTDSACLFFETYFSNKEQERRKQLLDQKRTLDLSHSKITSIVIDFKTMDIDTLILSHCAELAFILIKNGDSIKNLYLTDLQGMLGALLASCPKVELLEITNANLSKADLSAIVSCSSLQVMRLYSYVPYLSIFGTNLSALLIDIPEVHLSKFSFSTDYNPLNSNGIESLSLHNCTLHTAQVANIIAASKKLKFLDLKSCCYNLAASPLGPENVRPILKHLKPQLCLEMLNVNNVTSELFTPTIFLPILKNSPRLTTLKLANCNFLIDTLNSAIKNNDCLSHNIEEIDFTNCSSLTDEILNRVLVYFPMLKNLSIRNCNKITQVAFKNIDLSQFISLDITGCNRISDNYLKEIFANMELLQCLTIEGRTHIEDDVFDNAYFPNLLSVSLRDCVFLSDKCLSSLFIATCDKATGKGDPSASIRNLNIRNCRILTGAGLNQQAFNIDNLTCLIMRDCANLKSHHWIQIRAKMAEERAIDTIGCDSLPKSYIGETVSPSLTYFGVSNTFDYYLRWCYISQDTEIVTVARKMLNEAVQQSSFEKEFAAAAYAIDERNLLKDQIRKLGDPIDKVVFEERNMTKYGDKLGPTPERLLGTEENYLQARMNGFPKVNGKGYMSAEEAIDSASRSNEQITKMAKERFLSGALFLSIETMLLMHRLIRYENKVYGLTSELSGKLSAFVLVRSLGSFAAYCSMPIGYLAAVGTIAEIFLAMAGDQIGKDVHSYVYKPISKVVWGAYKFWHKPDGVPIDYTALIKKDYESDGVLDPEDASASQKGEFNLS